MKHAWHWETDYQCTVFDDWPTDGLTGDSFFELVQGGQVLFTSDDVPEVFVKESFDFSVECPVEQTLVEVEVLTDQWIDEDNHFVIVNAVSGESVLSRADDTYPSGAGNLVVDSNCFPNVDNIELPFMMIGPQMA